MAYGTSNTNKKNTTPRKTQMQILDIKTMQQK